MDIEAGLFPPEDERAGFIPPDAKDEFEADEIRATKLDQLEASGDILEDAAAFFDAIGRTHPPILQEADGPRVLDLLQRYQQGALHSQQQIDAQALGTARMSGAEKEYTKAELEALTRILAAHESKQ